mgnify:CR=1 FL=1
MSKPIPIPKVISKGSLIDYPYPVDPVSDINANQHNTNTKNISTQTEQDQSSSSVIMGYDRRFPDPPSYPQDKVTMLELESKITQMLYKSSPSQYDSYLSPDLIHNNHRL